MAGTRMPWGPGTKLCKQGHGASLGWHRAPQIGNKSLVFWISPWVLGAAPHQGKSRRPRAAFAGCSVSPVPWPRTCGMAFATSLIYILSVTQVSGRKQSGSQLAVKALLFTRLEGTAAKATAAQGHRKTKFTAKNTGSYTWKK